MLLLGRRRTMVGALGALWAAAEVAVFVLAAVALLVVLEKTVEKGEIDDGKCRRCGRDTHDASACYATVHIDGTRLGPRVDDQCVPVPAVAANENEGAAAYPAGGGLSVEERARAAKRRLKVRSPRRARLRSLPHARQRPVRLQTCTPCSLTPVRCHETA